MNELSNLESLWDRILSRQPESVNAAYGTLSPEEQDAIITHLKRMATETDWHPEQQKSAKAALTILMEDND